MRSFDVKDQRAIERYVVGLEDAGWHSLASGADAGASFYERVLDARPLMLLPGGLVLDDRAAIIASMLDQQWTSYRLEEPIVVTLTGNVAVIAYEVAAERRGAPLYRARVSSTYVRRSDGWKLALHQQTPSEPSHLPDAPEAACR